MKRKIAVYANGWSIDAVLQAVEGMKKFQNGEIFDIFVFLSHASYSEYVNINRGELNIYKLGDIRDFDGAIVFSHMLNSEETARSICADAKKYDVPVVSIGLEFEGIPYLQVDNENGMYQLVTHLVEKHQVKKVVYIGGTPGHVDSIARENITRSVLEEHGLSLKPEDTYLAYWGYLPTAEVVHKLLKSEEGLPDAIVCVNDTTALAAATELVSLGYEIPRDVIVTGFDNRVETKIFNPAITTVMQDYEEVGLKCCRMIFDQLQGICVTMQERASSRMVLGESCGCEGEEDYSARRKSYCQQSYLQTQKGGMMNQMERSMEQWISGARDYEGLKKNLRHFYLHNHVFEGTEFYVMLNGPYFRNPVASEEELWENGMPNISEVVVSIKNGELQAEDFVDHHTLVPGYNSESGETHVYYFMPMHREQYNYGYTIWVDSPMLMTGNMAIDYMERLQQALHSFRVNARVESLNQRLTKLYDKDPMTGLYNRFGYEDKAIPLYKESIKNGTAMMVMFVDINYMKRINDQFGHLHGDNAIKLVADAIQDTIDEGWIAVRFGGDEFLIIAPECEKAEAEKTKRRILNHLERKNEDGTRPYCISASCGYVITNPRMNLSLQDYIRDADKVMYEIKKEVHSKDAVD